MSDDTAMAIALANCIGLTGWNVDDRAGRYVSRCREDSESVNGRCFDIGIATRSALSCFMQANDACHSGSTDGRSSGKGAIMRLALLPIRFLEHFRDLVESLAAQSVASSQPTHASPQYLFPCRYMGVILAGMTHELERDAVLAPDSEPFQPGWEQWLRPVAAVQK